MPLSIATRASALRADGREREADVDRQHRLARLEARAAGRARRATARLERRAHVAARLANDRQRLPRVDHGAGDAVALRERQELLGGLGGGVELAGERVARGQGRGAARLFVDEPRGLARPCGPDRGARSCRRRRRRRPRSARARPSRAPRSPRRRRRLPSRARRVSRSPARAS